MNPPTFQRLSRKVLDEHEQIHFYLDQLHGSLKTLEDDGTDVEPLRRLAAQIGGLRERLEEHFESEENAGLFQGILELVPEARSEVHRLSAQHQRMVEILEMARIHAERAGPGEAGPLRDDLLEFLEMMREHERAEAGLVERALREESRAVD